MIYEVLTNLTTEAGFNIISQSLDQKLIISRVAYFHERVRLCVLDALKHMLKSDSGNENIHTYPGKQT